MAQAWWDKEAARLQEMGQTSDARNEALFSSDETRRAVVHTRQDVVLLVSYLSSANTQLATIRLLLWAAVALLALIVLRGGR